MGVHYHKQPIVTDGLVLQADAGNKLTSNTRLTTDNIADFSDPAAFITSNFSTNFEFGNTSWGCTMWIFYPLLPGNNQTHVVTGSFTALAAVNMNWFIFKNQFGTITFRIIRDGDLLLDISGGYIAQNVWTSLSFGFNDATQEMYFCKNGNYQVASVGATPPRIVSSKPFTIGKETQLSHYNWEGEMMNMRFWDRSLTEFEAVLFHQQGRGKKYNDSTPSELIGMKSWFPLIDDLTLDLHGTNTNSPNASMGLISDVDANFNTQKDLIDRKDFLLLNGASAFNDSFVFDGTDDYNKLPDNEPIYFPTDNITIEAWIRFNTVGTQMGIISCGISTNVSVSGRGGCALRVSSVGGIAFFLHTDTAKFQYTRKSLLNMDIGKFYHVVGVRDGQEMLTYIDGVDVSGDFLERNASNVTNPVTEIPDTSGIYYINTTNRAVTFGGELWNSQISPSIQSMFDGKISVIKVHDKALTPDEILQNYEAQKSRFLIGFTPSDLPSLKLWLDATDLTTINAGSPINNDPVNTWLDKSGDGNHAIMATPVRQALWNSTGYIKFDGIDDLLTNATKVNVNKGTLHFVVDMQSLATYNHIFQDSTSNNGLLFTTTIGSRFTVISNGSELEILSSGILIDTKYLVSVHWDAVDDTIDSYLNGVFVGSNTFGSQPITLGADGYRIGEWFNGTGDAEMKLYEIVESDIEDSPTDLLNTMNYLKAKHNIV